MIQPQQELSGPAEHGWRPTLIVGCPRSGTTLLAVMLGRHSKVAVGPETHFFHTFLPALPLGEYGSSPHLLDRALSHARIQDLGLQRADVEPHLSASARPGELFVALMEAYAATRRKRLWCEKTPDHLFNVELIRTWLPNVRFMCVQRDGRDVALSLHRVPWRRESLWRDANLWVRAARLRERYERELGADSFLTVRYEELVQRPRQTLTAVAGFLGLEFEESMLRANPSDEAAIPRQEREWKGLAVQPLDQSRVGGWRTRATLRERCIMNLVQGRYLSRLGYGDVTTHDCPTRLRVEAVVRKATWRLGVSRFFWRWRSRSGAPVSKPDGPASA